MLQFCPNFGDDKTVGKMCRFDEILYLIPRATQREL